MRLRWRVLIGAIATVATLTFSPDEAPGAPRIDRCEEDQPCWDCETMGNRICGPVTPPVPVPAQPTFTG